MKRKLRIKIMQEATKAKNICLVSKELTKKDNYRLRSARNKLNDKIEFYKMINKIMEDYNDKL